MQTNCVRRAHGLDSLHGSTCIRPAAAARSRRCQAFAVARPQRNISYVEIIQAHEGSQLEGRADCNNMQSDSTNSSIQPTQYLSDPAVYLDRDAMLQQVKNTVQQVVTVSKQAAHEVAAAFDPKQARSSSQHPIGIPANAAHSPAAAEAAAAQPQQPQPLQNLSRQAVRLTQAVSEDIHNATQDAYHRYGPHITAAGVRLVGKGAAAVGVEIIGKTNTARAIGQLGSTNAAAATEELGVMGVLKVSRRLGPVGVAKVVAKLGPRGVMNMASHICARMADGVRARAAGLNPEPQQHVDVDEVLARLEMYRSSSSSSSSSSSAPGSTDRDNRVLPVVALGVAMVQLVLNAIAGMLQGMSNLLKRGVQLWDAKHQSTKHSRHKRHSNSSSAAAGERTDSQESIAAEVQPIWP